MRTSFSQSLRRSRIVRFCTSPRSAVPAPRVSSRKNIHPMKVAQPEKITDLLEKLQVVLRGNPPPWLRKVMSKAGERSFDFEEETENA